MPDFEFAEEKEPVFEFAEKREEEETPAFEFAEGQEEEKEAPAAFDFAEEAPEDAAKTYDFSDPELWRRLSGEFYACRSDKVHVLAERRENTFVCSALSGGYDLMQARVIERKEDMTIRDAALQMLASYEEEYIEDESVPDVLKMFAKNNEVKIDRDTKDIVDVISGKELAARREEENRIRTFERDIKERSDEEKLQNVQQAKQKTEET